MVGMGWGCPLPCMLVQVWAGSPWAPGLAAVPGAAGDGVG